MALSASRKFACKIQLHSNARQFHPATSKNLNSSGHARYSRSPSWRLEILRSWDEIIRCVLNSSPAVFEYHEAFQNANFYVAVGDN